MAAITALSQLGGIVCVDGRGGETIITAKADGALIAGMCVGIVGAAGATKGDIIGADDAGTSELIVGLLLPKYNVDCDTAVADGLMVEIVIPKSGRHYNVACNDMGGNLDIGTGGVISSTIGRFTFALTDGVVYRMCNLSKYYTDDDTFCEVVWVA